MGIKIKFKIFKKENTVAIMFGDLQNNESYLQNRGECQQPQQKNLTKSDVDCLGERLILGAVENSSKSMTKAPVKMRIKLKEWT